MGNEKRPDDGDNVIEVRFGAPSNGAEESRKNLKNVRDANNARVLEGLGLHGPKSPQVTPTSPQPRPELPPTTGRPNLRMISGGRMPEDDTPEEWYIAEATGGDPFQNLPQGGAGSAFQRLLALFRSKPKV